MIACILHLNYIFSFVLFLSSTIKTYHSLLQCRLFSLRGIASIQEDLVQKNNVGINRGYVPLWGTTSIQEGFLWKIMWTFVIACVLSTNILILFIYVSRITISTLLIQLKCALVPLEEFTSAPVSVTVELPLPLLVCKLSEARFELLENKSSFSTTLAVQG